MNKYLSYRTFSGGWPPVTSILPAGFSAHAKLSWHDYDSELKLFKNSTKHYQNYAGSIVFEAIYRRTEKPVLITEGEYAGYYLYRSEYDLIGMTEGGTELTSISDFNSKHLIGQVTQDNFSTGNLVLPESIGKYLNNGEQFYFIPVFTKDDITDPARPIPPVFTRLNTAVEPPVAVLVLETNIYRANNYTKPLFYSHNIPSSLAFDNADQWIGYRIAQPLIKTRKLSNTTFQLFPDETVLDFYPNDQAYYYRPNFFTNNPESTSSHIMTSGGSNFTCNVYIARPAQEYKTGTEVAILPCESYYPPKPYIGILDYIWDSYSVSSATSHPMYASWLDSRYVNLETNEIQTQDTSMPTRWASNINDFGTGTKVQVKTAATLRPFNYVGGGINSYDGFVVDYVFTLPVDVYAGFFSIHGIILAKRFKGFPSSLNILLTNETDATKNGIWNVNKGNWYKQISLPVGSTKTFFGIVLKSYRVFKLTPLTSLTSWVEQPYDERVKKFHSYYEYPEQGLAGKTYNDSPIGRSESELPAGLRLNSEYYLIKNGKNISFARSYDDAIAQNKIPLQTMGYGIMCIYNADHSRSELPKKIISVYPDPIVTEDLDPINTYFIINKKYGIQLAETKDKAMAGEFLDVVLAPNTQYGLERVTTENNRPDNVHQDNKSFGWNPASKTEGNCFVRPYEEHFQDTTNLPLEALNKPAADTTGIYESSIPPILGVSFGLASYAKLNFNFRALSFFNIPSNATPIPASTGSFGGATETVTYTWDQINNSVFWVMQKTVSGTQAVADAINLHLESLINSIPSNFYFAGFPYRTDEKVFTLYKGVQKYIPISGVYSKYIGAWTTYNYIYYINCSIVVSGNLYENYKTGGKRATLTAKITDPTGASTLTKHYAYAGGVFSSVITGASFTVAVYVDYAHGFSGLNPIDGIVITSGTRVLVNNFHGIKSNGIWIAQTKEWVRASDANKNEDFVNGMIVTVSQGNINAGKSFAMASPRIVDLGISGISFVEVINNNLLPDSFTINHLEFYFPKHLPFNIEFDGALNHTWRKLTMTQGDKVQENITSDLISGDHRTESSDLSGDIVCTYNSIEKKWQSEPMESNNVKFKVEVCPYVYLGLIEGGAYTFETGLKVYGSPNTYLKMEIKTRYELVTSYIDGATKTFYRNSKDIFSPHFDKPYGEEVDLPYNYFSEDYYEWYSNNPFDKTVSRNWKIYAFWQTKVSGGNNEKLDKRRPIVLGEPYTYDFYTIGFSGAVTYIPNNGCELAILDPLVEKKIAYFGGTFQAGITDQYYGLANNTNHKLFGYITSIVEPSRNDYGLWNDYWVSAPTLTIVTVTGQGAEIEIIVKIKPAVTFSTPEHYRVTDIKIKKRGKYYWSKGEYSLYDHLTLTGLVYQVNSDRQMVQVPKTYQIAFYNSSMPTTDLSRRVAGFEPTPEERQAFNNNNVVMQAPFYPYRALGVDGKYEMPSVPSPAALGIISKLGFDLPAPPDLIPTPDAPEYTETEVV